MTQRGKLTVAQASLPAFVSTCSLCGARAIFLVESERPAVDHRCGTAAVGPVWTLVERPAATIAERAAVFVDGGVRTAEQARAGLLGAPASWAAVPVLEHAAAAPGREADDYLPAAV